MANRNVRSLNAKTAIVDGDPFDTLGGAYITIYTIGSSQGASPSATVKLQASPDKSSWVDIGTDQVLSGDGILVESLTEAHRFLRARLNAVNNLTVDSYIVVGGPLTGSWQEN